MKKLQFILVLIVIFLFIIYSLGTMITKATKAAGVTSVAKLEVSTSKSKIYQRLVKWVSGNPDKASFTVGIVTTTDGKEFDTIFKNSNINIERLYTDDYTKIDYSKYDVIIFGKYKQINYEEEDKIKDFLRAGRGVILTAGAPACMVSMYGPYSCSFSLTSEVDISEWFGAKGYTNWGGDFHIDKYHYVTQDFEINRVIGNCSSSCGAITNPYNKDGVLATVNGRGYNVLLYVYEPPIGGRVGYFSSFTTETYSPTLEYDDSGTIISILFLLLMVFAIIIYKVKEDYEIFGKTFKRVLIFFPS